MLAILLAGCGGQASAASSPSASASGGNVLSPAATVTNTDDGKTVQLRVGQMLDVALKADRGMANWQVQDPDPAILTPVVNPEAAAAQGTTLRAFKAVGAGTATLSATDRVACNPGQACSQAIRAFRATIIVSA